MDCLRRPRPPVSVVNSIIVAITMCVNAPTLAYYGPGYYAHDYNPLPYPNTLRRSIILPPLLDPQKTSPPFEKLLSQQATQIYLPPDVYRGFAYQTAYGDGGGTKVVFVRGPDANALLEESIRSISFPPVLPLSVTATSNVLKITQNNTTKTKENSQKAKTTEQNNTTASDAKLEKNAQNNPTNKEAVVPTSVILPPSHSLVTPGALYYSVPPGYVNSLAPAIPYFAQPFFNPPTDFFGRLNLPFLFSALDATAENAEISSNVPLPDTSGVFSESSASSNEGSSASASVPNSSGDEASSQPADTQTVSSSSSDNGASTGEEDSSSSEEASTESKTSGESSSSEASVSGSISQSSETSNSSEETSSTSETASDPEKSKDSVPSSDSLAESSTNTISANDSLPTGASIDSDTNSNDVPTKVDTGAK